MEFNQEEKDFIILRYKIRIILAFIGFTILTITFGVFSGVCFSKDDADLGAILLTFSLLSFFVAVCLGIYIFSKRRKR